MNYFARVLEIVFPRSKTCLICGHKVGSDIVCRPCREKIVSRHGLEVCPVCGRYLKSRPGNSFYQHCPECLSKPPAFSMARSVGPYQGTLKEAIYLYKYSGHRSLSEFFGRLLTEVLLDELTYGGQELLVPVPLSRQRMCIRGFNQSELLATKMSQILNLPVVPCIERVVDTPRQSKLTGKARRDSLKGAFRLKAFPGTGNVILIDDILTTGATAEECAILLREAGANSIHVLTLASGIQEK